MFLTIFLMLIVFIIIFLILTLILPVRIILNAKAGKDEDSWVKSRIMFFNGFAGVGVFAGKNFAKLSLWIMAKKLFEAEVKSTAIKLFKKIIKPKPEIPETEKVKLTFIDRLKLFFQKLKIVKKHYNLFKKFFREILIFENLSAEVRLSFTDPAAAGIAGGIIIAVNSILPHPWSVKPIWAFTGKGARLNVDMRAKIVMIKLWRFMLFNLLPVLKDFKTEMVQKEDDNSETFNEKTVINQEVN